MSAIPEKLLALVEWRDEPLDATRTLRIGVLPDGQNTRVWLLLLASDRDDEVIATLAEAAGVDTMHARWQDQLAVHRVSFEGDSVEVELSVYEIETGARLHQVDLGALTDALLDAEANSDDPLLYEYVPLSMEHGADGPAIVLESDQRMRVVFEPEPSLHVS